MKKILASLFILCLCFPTQAAVLERSVKLFNTTKDYLNNTPYEAEVIAIVKGESSEHLWVKQFIDKTTRQKIKRSNSAWAIEYKGETYFNLGYSTDMNAWKVFIKLSIKGRYCAAIVNKNSPNIIKNAGMNSGGYGGGIMGASIASSSKIGKNYVDEKGLKNKILFIDTQKIKSASMARNTASLGDLLSKKQLFELAPELKDKETVSLEEAVKVLQKLNNNSLEKE